LVRGSGSFGRGKNLRVLRTTNHKNGEKPLTRLEELPISEYKTRRKMREGGTGGRSVRNREEQVSDRDPRNLWKKGGVEKSHREWEKRVVGDREAKRGLTLETFIFSTPDKQLTRIFQEKKRYT